MRPAVGPGHCDCRDRAGGGRRASSCRLAVGSSFRSCRNPAGSTGTWVRPQIPGLSPGGLGPHRTACGSRAGFPPVSRLPARGLPLRLPSSGFPSSGVLRFGPFGRCCPVRFPFSLPPDSLSLEQPSRYRSRQAVPRALVPRSRDQGHQFQPRKGAPDSGSGRRRRARHAPLHLRSRDDQGSWRPGPGSFQRRARPGKGDPAHPVRRCRDRVLRAGHRNGLG